MKVTFMIAIETSVTSEGGWEEGSTLAQVMKQAYDEASRYQVLLVKGNGDPVPVAAKIELDSLRIRLDGDERSRTRVPR